MYIKKAEEEDQEAPKMMTRNANLQDKENRFTPGVYMRYNIKTNSVYKQYRGTGVSSIGLTFPETKHFVQIV